jgi:hypothetical protein
MKSALMTTALALATTALIAAVLGDRREISFRKPLDGEGVVFVDSSNRRPESTAEMVREAAAIVVARYTGRQRLVGLHEVATTVRTYSINYEFEILETLKFHPLLPSNPRARVGIDLREQERRTATGVFRTKLADAVPLRPHHTYVAFFARNYVRPELYLAWMADSLYDVTGSTVEPVNRGDRSRANLSAAAFLDILRQAEK